MGYEERKLRRESRRSRRKVLQSTKSPVAQVAIRQISNAKDSIADGYLEEDEALDTAIRGHLGISTDPLDGIKMSPEEADKYNKWTASHQKAIIGWVASKYGKDYIFERMRDFQNIKIPQTAEESVYQELLSWKEKYW